MRLRVAAGAVAVGCYGEVVANFRSILTSLAGGILSSLLGGSKTGDAAPRRSQQATGRVAAPPRTTAGATVEIAAREAGALRLSYNPATDGTPDPGEIVWTWVPFEENDGRGKDRPVLVVGRLDAKRVVAFALTSKPHDGERDYVSLGVGEWDRDHRPSWVDLDRVLRVDDAGMRREGSVLDRKRFAKVAAALAKRYGWRAA